MGTTWTRNAAGVKDGAECYRTINGLHWSWFAEDASWLREKVPGIRCRKPPDGQGAFVHPKDADKTMTALSL